MKNNKGIKKTVLLSALAAIAFGAVAVTTSYALFTDTSETNVTVSAGKVDVSATASLTKVYSPKSINSDGTIADDSNAATFTEGESNGKFALGGTIALNDNTLSLSNIAPGDKVGFDIKVSNSSTVTIKYRVVYKLNEDTTEAKEFASSLKITRTIDEDRKDMTGILEYRSAYVTKEVTETDLGTMHFVVEYPSTATIQGASCSFSIAIEAVQGNANTDDSEFVSKYTKASSADDVKSALNSVTSSEGASITLAEDITLNESLPISGNNKEVEIDLNNKSLDLSSNALTVNGDSEVTLSNGTVKGGPEYTKSMINVKQSSSVSLSNVSLETSNDLGNALAVFDSSTEVNIDGCSFKTGNWGYGLATNGQANDTKITVRNTNFASSGQAIFLPGDADVELIDCTVSGYVSICGGKTLIQGGTYTKDLNGSGMYDAYKNNVGEDNKNSDSDFYISQTGDGNYYTSNDAAIAGYKKIWTSGSVVFWDVITITENRPNYNFTNCTIKDVTINLANKPSNEIIFGIRYIDCNDANKYESDNVKIDNCTYTGVSYNTSGDFFKTLTSE